ncbi:MAG: tRNA uridine-5-carboxymethylaminomethyl(34) synthesis GTPase MnmE [Anaplasmataceae bacterium]|nr:tRNA uridine-5-carboxymethylaminomethyl(34) synthesis GTPase MnmE [Anaplasmataceae bacterium]
MQFTHRPFDPHATIAAIATPPGEGGVAIIRISGSQALDIAAKVFSKSIHMLSSHTVSFGKFLNHQGNAIDEGLALVMRAPKSYTGENVVEFHCHGGHLISRHLLDAVLFAGAKMAEPGEFTRKAFLNGKLDLAQAEAVQSLIAAKNTLALKAAEQQLDGKLSKRIKEFQQALTDIAAILEAWVDFPEEGLEFASLEEILETLHRIHFEMKTLGNTFGHGQMLHQGFSLCLAGKPNAGKSSLMNTLLGQDRAIVTPIPGTTRDVLQEDFTIGTLHFRLTDTAGLRHTEEIIEQEGIRRTHKAMANADLVLFVIDSTLGLQEEDLELLSSLPKNKTLLVWNKSDLPNQMPLPEGPFPLIKLSAIQGSGIEDLKELIQTTLWNRTLPDKQEILLTNARHYEALMRSIQSIETLLAGLHNHVSPEFLSLDIRQALLELGTIIGSDITEDILSAIFSKFCVGK